MSAAPHADAKASFGFQDVPRAEKAARVRRVFDGVASRYDLMNDLMSGGAHRIWKSVFLDRIRPQPGETLIDAAAGTGDIARAFIERANARPRALARPLAHAIAADVNAQMLLAGRARDGALGAQLSRLCADAEALPIADRRADAYTIAFGVRNVTERARALGEARRVLKRGGRFACLEFSRPVTATLEKLYDAYSFAVIPRLGRLVTGDEDAYRYLVESIRRFPSQSAFAAEIERAGFARVSVENLSGGVVAIHRGWRL